MTLPGFTAEFSIYERFNHYEMKSGSADSNDGQTVVPQRAKVVEVSCTCDEYGGNCICDFPR